MNAILSEYNRNICNITITFDDSSISNYQLYGKQHITVCNKLISKKEFWKLKGYCEKYGELVVVNNNLDFTEIMRMLA